MSDNSTLAQEGPQQQGLSLATLAAHASIPRKPMLGGQNSAQKKSHILPQNAHVTPLFQTTVFDFDSIQTAADQVLRQGAYRMSLSGAKQRRCSNSVPFDACLHASFLGLGLECSVLAIANVGNVEKC